MFAGFNFRLTLLFCLFSFFPGFFQRFFLYAAFGFLLFNLALGFVLTLLLFSLEAQLFFPGYFELFLLLLQLWLSFLNGSAPRCC